MAFQSNCACFGGIGISRGGLGIATFAATFATSFAATFTTFTATFTTRCAFGAHFFTLGCQLWLCIAASVRFAINAVVIATFASTFTAAFTGRAVTCWPLCALTTLGTISAVRAVSAL